MKFTDIFDSAWYPVAVFVIVIGIIIGGFFLAVGQGRERVSICAEYGTSYYAPARACLTTYGALIVPKEFQ